MRRGQGSIFREVDICSETGARRRSPSRRGAGALLRVQAQRVQRPWAECEAGGGKEVPLRLGRSDPWGGGSWWCVRGSWRGKALTSKQMSSTFLCICDKSLYGTCECVLHMCEKVVALLFFSLFCFVSFHRYFSFLIFLG